MSAVVAGSASPPVARIGSRALRAGVSVASAVAILMVAFVPLLTPWFLHPALDAARSSAWLGVSAAEVHRLSDASVHELVFGPGSFAVVGPDGRPLYDAAEVSHLRDARLLLLLLLGAGIVAIGVVAVALWRAADRAAMWRAVARGALGVAVATVVIGAVAIVAFDPLFELFHRLAFPGGNWAFDPRTERLVQLYPYAFFEIAASALGVLLVVVGLVVWFVARTVARRGAGEKESAGDVRRAWSD